MQIRGLGLGGVVAIVALVGCGSSGTGGTGGSTGTGTGGGTGSGTGGTTGSGGPFTTSVPSGTKVTGLTAAQAAQLCSDVESYVDNNFFPAICRARLRAPGAGSRRISTSSRIPPRALPSCEQPARAPPRWTPATAARTASMPALRPATSRSFRRPARRPWVTTRGVSTIRTAADLQLYTSAPNCSTLTAASLMAYFAVDGGSSNPPEPASCSTFDSTCKVDGGTVVMPATSLSVTRGSIFETRAARVRESRTR